MGFDSDLVKSVCVDNIDLAIEGLSHFINTPKSDREDEWAHNVCTYTRFVHMNTWSHRISLSEACKVLQLLSTALKAVTEHVEQTELSVSEEHEEISHLPSSCCPYENAHLEQLKHYAENISLRVTNVEERYLKRLPSKFDPADPDPSAKFPVSVPSGI